MPHATWGANREIPGVERVAEPRFFRPILRQSWRRRLLADMPGNQSVATDGDAADLGCTGSTRLCGGWRDSNHRSSHSHGYLAFVPAAGA
jgi:hypothetical protein